MKFDLLHDIWNKNCLTQVSRLQKDYILSCKNRGPSKTISNEIENYQQDHREFKIKCLVVFTSPCLNFTTMAPNKQSKGQKYLVYAFQVHTEGP